MIYQFAQLRSSLPAKAGILRIEGIVETCGGDIVIFHDAAAVRLGDQRHGMRPADGVMQDEQSRGIGVRENRGRGDRCGCAAAACPR